MIRTTFRLRSALLAAVAAAIMLPGCSLLPPRYQSPFAAADPYEEQFLTTSERIDSIRQLRDAAGQLAPADQARYAEGLANTFRSEENPNVRLELARTLAVLNSPTSDQILILGTRDSDVRIRVACCELLANRPSDDALRALSDLAANSQDVDSRIAAIRALGARGDEKAVPALAVALEDRDPALQYRAVESLKQVTGKDVGNDVRDWIAFTKGEPIPEKPSVAQRLIPWF